MNIPIALALLFTIIGCRNQISKPVMADRQEELLSGIRKNVLASDILLHHQIQKRSLIVKQTTSAVVIDSFFSYIGTTQEDDSLCFRPGVFNRYGEIRLFTDTLDGSRVGTLYFVVDGGCAGFYIGLNGQLRKYSFSADGKKFFGTLDSMYSDRLR